MKIDYCKVHDSPATKRDPEWCWSSAQINERHDCRMVPMRLIPDNAEPVIDRTALAEALGPPEMFGTFTEGNVLIRQAARAWLALGMTND